ncbi:DUF4397 domain-containing protein [Myxococcaceae bacterium GXIMD 01537]
MAWNVWKRVAVATVAACAALVAGSCGEGGEAERPSAPIPMEKPPVQQPARLRLIHAAPDAPHLDIRAQGQVEPLLADVEYGETTPFRSLPPGVYTFEARPAGAAANAAPLFTSDAVAVETLNAVTLVAVGLTAEDAPAAARFRVLLLEDGFAPAGPGMARVRVVHAGADAPMVALDVGDDGSVELERLAPFQVTDGLGMSVPAGTPLQVGLRTTDTGEKLTAFTLPPLPAGGEVLLVATGLIEQAPREDTGFALLAADRDTTIGFVRQNPRIYALHASPDAPEVDFFLGARELSDGLGFGALSGSIQLPPGRYTLDLFEHTDAEGRPAGAPVASGATQDLESGQRYLVTVAGLLAPTPGSHGLTLISTAESFVKDPANARLRLVNALPDTPPVDVGPLDDGLVPTVTVFDNVAFGTASSPPGEPLPAGPMRLGLASAESSDRTPLFTFTLDATPFVGRGFFAVAAGSLTPTQGQRGFELWSVDTSASPWTVQPIPVR